MKIPNKSLLVPINDIEELNKYIAKDKKYMITAIPITTSRFGPSGSLKNKNITLEHIIDVMPKISSEVFFDLKYIFSNYTSFIRAAGLGFEPRYADPESAVLPLDDPAIKETIRQKRGLFNCVRVRERAERYTWLNDPQR